MGRGRRRENAAALLPLCFLPLPRPAPCYTPLRTPSLSPGLSDRPQVQCVRTYKALQPDELTLEKTDILAVRTQTSDGERGLLGRPPSWGLGGWEVARWLRYPRKRLCKR